MILCCRLAGDEERRVGRRLETVSCDVLVARGGGLAHGTRREERSRGKQLYGPLSVRDVLDVRQSCTAQDGGHGGGHPRHGDTWRIGDGVCPVPPDQGSGPAGRYGPPLYTVHLSPNA